MEGISKVDVIIDDLLVYGKEKNDHDKHLQAVLDRIENNRSEIEQRHESFQASKIRVLWARDKVRGYNAECSESFGYTGARIKLNCKGH